MSKKVNSDGSQSSGLPKQNDESDQFNANDKCKVCGILVTSKCRGIKCDGICGKWHHIKCSSISDQEYKKISDLGEKNLWLCDDDIGFFEKFKNSSISNVQKDDYLSVKHDIIKSEKNVLSAIDKMHRSIERLENMTTHNSDDNLRFSPNTYANVLKSKITGNQMLKKSSTPGVIIKPKAVQSSSITKDEVMDKINPATIKVGISSIKTLSNGSFVIKTYSESENIRLMEEAEKKLVSSYEVSRTKLRKPRLFLSGLNKKYEEDEFLDELRSVNQCITTEDEINIVFTRQNKTTKKWMMSLEVSGNTFNKLVDKYINVGWKSYFLKEDRYILRCFKCQGYHHNSLNCKNGEICKKCSGNHSFKDCNCEEVLCYNCNVSNNKFRTQFSVDHHADSLNYSVFLSNVQKMRSNIAYSTESQCL